MQTCLSLTAAACLVLVGGCASVSEPDAPGREALPAWTDKSQFEDQGGARQVFVGIGQAGFESEAKRRARSDAQSQYTRAVGSVVVTSQRQRETTSTDDRGISHHSVAGQRYTGSTASALLHSTESEYVTLEEDTAVTVFYRMSMPTQVLEDARDQVKRRDQRAIKREAEAYRLAQDSRGDGVDGYVYALVVEKASAIGGLNRSFIEVEQKARQKARHRARISLAGQVYGSTIKSMAARSGAQFETSYVSTTGHVQSELIAERVWWEGDSAVAEAYMLGWKKQE